MEEQQIPVYSSNNHNVRNKRDRNAMVKEVFSIPVSCNFLLETQFPGAINLEREIE